MRAPCLRHVCRDSSTLHYLFGQLQALPLFTSITLKLPLSIWSFAGFQAVRIKKNPET